MNSTFQSSISKYGTSSRLGSPDESHKKPTVIKSYHELKAVDVNQSLLTNYEGLYKSDVRSSKIGGYLDKARETYNDWEIKYNEI